MKEPRYRRSGFSADLLLPIFAALLVLTLVACATEPQPEEPMESALAPPAVLQHLETEHRMHSFTSAGLRLRFSVSQPGKQALSLQGYRFRLESGGEQLASGTRSLDSRTVPAGGSTHFDISVQVPLQKKAAPASSTASAGSLPYQVFVEIEAASEAETVHRLTSTISGSVPAPQLPRLSIPRVRIPQFETKIIRIEYELQFDNPNSFPVQLLPGGYTFTVDETPWDRDRLPAELTIPANEAKHVFMPMTINYLKAGRDTVNILMGAKTLDYRLTGEAQVLPVESEQRSEQRSDHGEAYRFSFDSTGTAAIIRP